MIYLNQLLRDLTILLVYKQNQNSDLLLLMMMEKTKRRELNLHSEDQVMFKINKLEEMKRWLEYQRKYTAEEIKKRTDQFKEAQDAINSKLNIYMIKKVIKRW